MNTTKIEWAESTWNPVTGCTKTSPGCQNCYAERMAKRQKAMGTKGYENGFKVTLHPERLDEPLRWRKPRRIFVCSMGDLFHEDVPFEFIEEVHSVIRQRTIHTFIMLTKRPQRMLDYWRWRVREFLSPSQISRLPFNAWYGVTAEDQQRADERIQLLLQTPAAVRFVSIEPMLGPVDTAAYKAHWRCVNCGATAMPLTDHTQCQCPCECDDWEYVPGLDWVILGGESGPGARPMHPDWVRSVRDQCAEAGVPFLFKQWGEWALRWGDGTHLIYRSGAFTRPIGPAHEDPDAWETKEAEVIARVGKKLAGRLLDGRLHDEYPKEQGNG